MSTSVNTSRARSRACAFVTSRCNKTPSAICFPMVMVGLSEVIGSCGISATSSPLTRRISFSSSPAMSRPSSVIVPSVTCPLPGSRRMMERPVVLFPHPDSPTTPTHSPWSTEKETPSSATTVEWRMRNSVRRFSTFRTDVAIDEMLLGPGNLQLVGVLHPGTPPGGRTPVAPRQPVHVGPTPVHRGQPVALQRHLMVR